MVGGRHGQNNQRQMSFFLSKLLPLFVYPAGLVSLLLVACLFNLKNPRRLRTFLLFALCILFLGGNRWVSMSLVRSLEQRYLPPKELARADVAVILGGGTDAPQYPRTTVELNGAGDRVIYGFKLYKDQIVPRLIVTGGNAEWQGEFSTSPAQDMAALYDMFGVPKDAVILEPDSLNTYEDAQYTAKIIQAAEYQKVILVTSALHMPRAVRLFQQAGIVVTPTPVDYTITDQEWKDLWSPTAENILINLMPTSANLKSTTSSLKEYIGMLVNQITD